MISQASAPLVKWTISSYLTASHNQPGDNMVTEAYNPSTQEVETGGLGVQAQPQLHCSRKA